uniref:Uncharacterized protein n=1 Tax=Anguilla anguilla TaxID=7936 RepID=A0A0E9Q3D7_ANGAN
MQCSPSLSDRLAYSL